MRRVAVALVLFGSPALVARVQPPPVVATSSVAQTLILSGRVFAEDTGEAIANVRVVLTGSTQNRPVLTDRDGGFVLNVPLGGRYTLVCSKSGYGRREITGSAADRPIDIRLVRGAAISGRVVDALGDPIVGARIVAETAVPSTQTRSAAVAATETDDRGEYRLGSLQTGTFTVAAITPGAMNRTVIGPNQIAIVPTIQKIYYPGAETSDGAEALRLEPGDDRPAIDFVLPAGQSGGQRFSMTFVSPLARPAEQDSSVRGTGIVRGRVVATDGRPVAHAQARLMQQRAAGLTSGAPVLARDLLQSTVVTADDDGRFEFRELPAGSYRIAAGKAGYSAPGEPVTFGPPPPTAGLAVDLADGQTREQADFTLARWATLAGRVFDELGDPLQGASVQLLQVQYQRGRRRLVAVGGVPRVTDDLGRFRTYGLAPGPYIVSAAVGDVASSDLPGYARSYYPGTPDAAQAQFVSIGVSQDVTGIDFSMERTRTALVSGTLLDATGAPTTGGTVRLMPSRQSTSVTSVPVGARLQADGRFEFPNVPSGQYVIQADRGRKNGSTEGEFGAVPVSVDGADVTNLVLQTSVGSSIRGHVTFESYQGTKAPRSATIEITPVPIDPDQAPASQANADIHEDWSFEIAGVTGPRRLQVVRAPDEWALREIRVRGIDVTDRPLVFGTSAQSLAEVEVVLTDRINELNGTIVDDHGRASPMSHLVVFSTDRDRWYPASRFLRQTAAGPDGTIALAGLPPGTYYATAVAQLPADGEDAWQDPAYLESLRPRASTITFGEGQKQQLNLRLDSR